MSEHVRAVPLAARVLLRHVCDARYRDVVAADIEELFRLRIRTIGRRRAAWRACRDALSISTTTYARKPLRTNREETVMHCARDLRHAARALYRTPAFTLVVLATFGLAIGATTAIFSVVDGVLLSPLPYDEPGGIMVIQETGESMGDEVGPMGASQIFFLQWRDGGRSFDHLAMYSLESTTMASLDEPVRLNGAAATPALFPLLRVDAALGRLFGVDAELPGNDDVILLSHTAWQRYFGGDPSVIGTSLRLDRRLRTVLGVMPEGFAFPGASVEYWVPMLTTPPESMSVAVGADEAPPTDGGQQNQSRRAERRVAGGPGPGGDGPGPGGGGPEGPEAHAELWGRVIGRLAAGVTPEMASQEGDTLLAGIYANDFDDIVRHADVQSMQDSVVGSVRGPLLMLLGAVAFVLLIACANIANLVLARSVERRKETAVRAAVGAGMSNLIRYSLAESTLLTGVGALLGLVLAVGGLRAVAAVGPDFIPRLNEVSIDLRVLAFTAVVAAVTAITFGLLPARSVARLDLNRALKEEFGDSAGGGRSGFRRLLVTVEIALAVVLLVGAGLLVSSFVKLTSVDPGYDADNLLHLSISLPATAYPDAESHLSYYDTLVSRLEALPGVLSSTVANRPPYLAANIRVGISAREGNEAPSREDRPTPVGVRMVENGYFDALRTPAAEGRVLNRDDRPETQQVAVLSRAGARAMFGDRDPVGEELDFIGGQRLLIVGLVEDVRTSGVDPTPQADIFLPYRQVPQMVPALFRTAELLVRTGPAPLSVLPSVRTVLRDLDRQVLVLSAATVRDRVADSIAEPRFYAGLVTAFAALSLALSAVGIYGMLAYVVQQGVRDTAIRRALGAPVGQILGTVLREGMGLAVVGLLIGAGGALLLTRGLESMLYEVEPGDPTSLGIVAVIFLAVAMLAVWIPARRATLIDPMEVLRSE